MHLGPDQWLCDPSIFWEMMRHSEFLVNGSRCKNLILLQSYFQSINAETSSIKPV